MSKIAYGSKAAESKGAPYSTRARTLQVAEDIIPIAQLKAQLSEIVRGLDQRPRPLVITLNGKPAAVLMSTREFDAMKYRDYVLTEISHGLADAAAGRGISDEELGRRTAERYLGKRWKSRK